MNISRLQFAQKLLATVIGAIVFSCIANAQSFISTDGTTGTAGVVNFSASGAQHIVINGVAHGTQNGSNLFFSFNQFSIAAGDTALFQCPSCVGVTNVISRVTGFVSSSNFNGSLTSTIGNANFWFFNPRGVAVNATINVPVSASYYISNASQVNFKDGSTFGVSGFTLPSTLSAAAPVDFGFANRILAQQGKQPIIISGTNTPPTPTLTSTPKPAPYNRPATNC